MCAVNHVASDVRVSIVALPSLYGQILFQFLCKTPLATPLSMEYSLG